MFKRLILIGALVISIVAMSGTHANAQSFDGWGWFGFSEIEGEIRTMQNSQPTRPAFANNSYRQRYYSDSVH